MELPDDVLEIVRAFAKPRFKYFREYNNARKRFRLLYFPDINPCLCKNPERILPVLKRLEYWDEEYIRLSNDFQKRYYEYVACNQISIKREGIRAVLDELLYVREEVHLIANHHRIAYQKN